MSQNELGREHIIALNFGLIGVVQGLAFTKLAEKLPITFNEGQYSFAHLSNIVYFLVGFLIVARVFQTYASGTVAYAQSHMKVWDLYAIFVAGLLQYWLFDTFKDNGTIEKDLFLQRVMYLAILAFSLHLLVYIREVRIRAPTGVQKVNMIFAFGIFSCCMLSNWVRKDVFSYYMAVVISLMLIANTYNSMKNTDFTGTPEDFDSPK